MTAKELKTRMEEHGFSLSERMAIYIINRKHKPSVKMAVRLEQATGTLREAWIWPERYHNPHIEKKSWKESHAPNRLHNIQHKGA